MSLACDTLVLGPMDNNVYLLNNGSECMVIDAATDAPRIKKEVEDRGLHITQIFTTHRHWDHVEGLKELVALTGAPTYASAEEKDLYPVAPTYPLNDGDTVPFDGQELETFIIHGHTEGGCVLVTTIDGVYHLFVGDNLFPGGVGKTNSPEEFNTLYTDVVTKIFDRFPDNTVILPGHGRSTTLGAERPHLAEWKERGW